MMMTRNDVQETLLEVLVASGNGLRTRDALAAVRQQRTWPLEWFDPYAQYRHILDFWTAYSRKNLQGLGFVGATDRGWWRPTDAGRAQVQTTRQLVERVPVRRTGPQSLWHSQMVRRIAGNPSLVISDLASDPIVSTWCDACRSADGKPLWLILWSSKHPDVVFLHASGKLTVIEVEPNDTAYEGFAQLWGDYCIMLQVDRCKAGVTTLVEGMLVTPSAAADLRKKLGYMIERSGVRLLDLGMETNHV